MDNYFFRECMPYEVSYDKDKDVLVVKNRYYNTLFACKKPENLELDAFFKSFASDSVDCLRSNQAFLYDDKTSPIGNVNGYDKVYMDKYFDRLRCLLNSVRGFLSIEADK